MKPNAKLGPWDLYLEDVSDSVPRDLSVTEYPYRVGADVEDMGPKAERYSFRAVINGDDFDANYIPIRTWFRQVFTSPIELEHPDLGTVSGYPATATFVRNNRKRFAEFTFEFVVDGLDPAIAARPDAKAQAITKTQAINEDAQAAIADEMAKAGVPDVKGSDWSLLDKWSDMGAYARKFALACSTTAGKLRGAIALIEAPADAISSTITYVESLSGSLVSQMQQCMEAYVALGRQVSSSSDSRSTSLSILASIADNGQTMLDDGLMDAPASVRSSFAQLASMALCYESSRLMAEDEAALAESVASEKIALDDAEGHPSADETSPYLLTPSMLEDSLALVRQFIQKNLPVMDKSSSVEAMANTLTDAVRRFKLEYLSTKKIVVTSPRPLHRIILDAGLPYKAAERVCALNGFKNPTFCSGEVLVYEP